VISATSQRPASMAVAACATCASKAEPPMLVASTKRGTMPRYSDSVTVGNWPGPGTPHMPAVSSPSTSRIGMPASASASRAHRAWACSTDIGAVTLPSFKAKSATPTITASGLLMDPLLRHNATQLSNKC
jgi:hypothetical protein